MEMAEDVTEVDRLCQAIAAGESEDEIRRRMIERPGELGITNWKFYRRRGLTVLMAASQNGHLNAVEALLKRGTNANASNENGWTALMCASRGGHVGIVELLLKSNADANATNKDGRTSLMYASRAGHVDVVEVLLRSRADANAIGKYGWTALMGASRYNHVHVVEMLLKANADANAVEWNGWTMLMHASCDGHVGVVEMLLTGRADVNAVRADGWTALMHASRGGHTGAVKLLLKSEADANATSKDGCTALMYACMNGHVTIVEMLLGAFANVHATNKNGWSALMYASCFGHAGVIKLLLKNGADANGAKKDGGTALMCASRGGHVGVVKLLLKTNVDANAIDKNGRSVLMQASMGGHAGVVGLLLNASINVNAVDKSGSTALMLAGEKGAVDVVKMLLSAGADVNVTNKDGNSVLHVAAAQPCWMDKTFRPLAECLVKAGIDQLLKNKEGKTALDVAATESKRRILQVIEADHLLVGVEKEKAKRVRVSVLGDQAVGKTELVSTLTDPEGAKRRDFVPAPAEGTPEYFAQRTSGIKITPFVALCSVILIFMDYAGQAQFLASHSPLLATNFGLFVLVLDLSRGPEKMLKSAHYWLRFVTATRDPDLYPHSPRPRLFLVFSHADQVPPNQSSSSQMIVNREVQKEFSRFFTLMDSSPYVLNCCKECDDMKRLRNELVSAHAQVIEEMPREACINNKIRDAIERERQHLPDLVLNMAEYLEFLKMHVSLEMSENNSEAIQGSLQLLDLQCDVLMVRAPAHKQDFSTFVILNPIWFCEDVFKVVLSPREFPSCEIIFPKHGVCTEAELDAALTRAGINPSVAKAFLELCNICDRNSPNKDQFFFPFHLSEDLPQGSWEEDENKPVQGGIQVFCRTVPASPVYMSHLQLEFARRTGGISENTCIWKSGMIFDWPEFVTIKMELPKSGHDVTFIARAVPDSLLGCSTALHGVSDIAMKTALAITPGSKPELRYLSPHQLAACQEPTVAYTAEEVLDGCKNKVSLRRKALSDDPSLILPIIKATQQPQFLASYHQSQLSGPQTIICQPQKRLAENQLKENTTKRMRRHVPGTAPTTATPVIKIEDDDGDAGASTQNDVEAAVGPHARSQTGLSHQPAKRPPESCSDGRPSKRRRAPATERECLSASSDEWRGLALHEEPKLVNKLCDKQWNFGQHWREIFRYLLNTKTRAGLAFPSPEGEIREIEQQKNSRNLTLSECFREVLNKWMDVCSPTADDLYGVMNAQGLGEKARRCFEEYALSK